MQLPGYHAVILPAPGGRTTPTPGVARIAAFDDSLNDFDNPREARFDRWRDAERSLTVQPDGRVTRDEPSLGWFQRVRFGLFTRSCLYRYLDSLFRREDSEPGGAAGIECLDVTPRLAGRDPRELAGKLEAYRR